MQKEIKEEMDKQKTAIDKVLKKENSERMRIDSNLAAYHENIISYELKQKNKIEQHHNANMKRFKDEVSELTEELEKNNNSSEAIEKLLDALVK